MIRIPYYMAGHWDFLPLTSAPAVYGWTLADCETPEAARVFLACLPAPAWMPGTRRLAERLGVPIP